MARKAKVRWGLVLALGSAFGGWPWVRALAQTAEVGRVYAERAGRPIWTAGGAPTAAAESAVVVLSRAGDQGLDPDDYDAFSLDATARRLAEEGGTAAELGRFDTLLTLRLFRYLDDLHGGRLRPNPLGRYIARPGLATAIVRAAEADTVAELVAATEPGLVQYRALKRLLPGLRQLARDATLVPPPPGPTVRPGDRYESLLALTRLLATLGDLPPDSALAGARYEGAAVAAVRRFQSRHGLDPDGVIGPATQEALRVPLAWRVRQVELALERLRWLPTLRGRALAVNVPAFHLFGFDSAGVVGGPQIDMRVVVGRALDTRTPMLLEEMKYVEFRPYWNVPRSILVKEILPQLGRQPDYLRRNRMELVGPRGAVLGDEVTADVLRRLARGELRIRQRPGLDNALGTLKFVFPNSSDIYLHATPAAQLFSRSRRDFSHGCIRVQDPEGLAAWVLRDEPGWTRDSIRAAMSGTRTFRVPLTRPLPVAVFYTTVAAWPDGRASFYEDIYGHDRALDRALRPRLQSVSARD